MELTINLKIQEQSRQLNSELEYPEHPRPGVTDDLETLYSMFHCYLGPVFTLKQFKEMSPKTARYLEICLLHHVRRKCVSITFGSERDFIEYVMSSFYSHPNTKKSIPDLY